MELLPHNRNYDPDWDQFCQLSQNATFLHTRSFLNYHGNRFQDQSLIIRDSGVLIGLFPAAVDPSNKRVIVSHPGATFGGVIHQGRLTGSKMIETLKEIINYYKKLGFSKILYKAVPHIYCTVPSQDDSYAMFRTHAKRVRCDLSSCVDLQFQRKLNSRRRRGIQKSLAVLTISNDNRYLDQLWPVLQDNLQRKHYAMPVHSLEEMKVLLTKFPKNIQLKVGLIDDRVEAGVVLFTCQKVCHAQYIAASKIGYMCAALDAIFNDAIMSARESNKQFFDFGTSNENAGIYLNDGLYKYKTEFGGGGVVHEYFEFCL